MTKNTNDIWERLHGIALGTGKVSGELESLTKTISDNTNKLIDSLNKNSKSSDFLAWVGIFIGIVGVFATIIGTFYGYLSYIK